MKDPYGLYSILQLESCEYKYTDTFIWSQSESQGEFQTILRMDPGFL